jgi:hypothetical protein
MEHYYNFYEKMGKLHKKLEEEIKVVFETGTAYFTYIDNHSPPSIPNPKKPTHGEVDRTLEWFSENILTLEETIKKEELDYFPPFERALRNLINGIYEHFGLK